MRVNQANANTNAAYRILKNEEFKNQLHEERYIHIHDKEYTGVSYNCIGIELREKLNELKKNLGEIEIDEALNYVFQVIVSLTNDQSGGIGFINIDSDLAEFVQEISEEKLITKIRRLYKNLNLPLRNGYEKAYVSFNLGLDTSENGRKVTRCFLKAFEHGEVLNGLPFVFPNIIFKVKKGINFDFGDKNYDLFSLAARVTGKRMNPTYFNCDSILVKDINEKKVGIMGCRTLVARNVNGEEGALKRGNIASISINLPKIARESMDLDDFYKKLSEICDKSKDILIQKYEALCKLEIDNFKYILENNFYENSETSIENNNMKNSFKNGTLSIGFIGLFDCVSYLMNEKISLEMIENNLELSKGILKFIRELTDEWTKKYSLNFSVLATPGEGISGRFCEDEETKEFYTNSFHIPVYLDLDAFKKLELESKFVEYCNGGSISYVEFSTPVLNNSEAIMDVIKYGILNGVIYLGINFPLDYCGNCKTTGIFEKKCSCCGSAEIKKLRRVSGYLSYKETLKGGKKAEEKLRKSHFKCE